MILVIVAVTIWVQLAESWSYSDQDQWPAQCQQAQAQSPINIDSLQVRYDSDLARRFRCNYVTAAADSTIRGTVLHEGHRLRLDVDQTDNHTCYGAPSQPIAAAYRLAFLDLHWAQTDSSPGSEHAVNGEYADAELHLVHFNADYGTYEDALTRSDGLLVVAIMVTAGVVLPRFRTRQ